MQANFDGSPAQAGAVTLDNCDSEPIHMPGHVQPHGALFAFDLHHRLTHRSRNAAAMLGAGLPGLGESLAAEHFADVAGFHALMAKHAGLDDDEVIPQAVQVQAGGRAFELIVHRSGAHLLCEFEQNRGAVPLPHDFASVAQRAMERLKRQTTVDSLLTVAVQAVRSLTGFDRVMAYRFRHDDSGEVVAESAEPALEPFLGQRYPAGDIPQQARRLYILNTLRLIGDVGAAPVAIEQLAGAAAPLDMSYGVLRSVSPIHLEYLGNMGVAASMSVSIVIGGQLWGMLACHHQTPRRVAYAVRMACDTLAQILASHLQGALGKERIERADGYGGMRSRLVEAVRHDEDLLVALAQESSSLLKAFDAHAVVIAQGWKIQVHGGVAKAAGVALVQWLNLCIGADRRMLLLESLESMPGVLQERLAGWAGVLALPFGDAPGNWLVLLRKEEIETISWGGKPEKVYRQGPSGPRLTPRGSFELWKEIVRGKCVPWDENERDSAQKLLDDLMRAEAVHVAERGRRRSELMVMLGSDLRGPVQSIIDTATQIRASGGDQRLGERLQSTGARMQRLVGQVIDVSRNQSGTALRLQTQQTDLVAMLRLLMAETRSQHPHMEMLPILPAKLMAEVDPDRIAQAIGHLLSNASQHGLADEPVLVELRDLEGTTVLEVSNAGLAIPPGTVRGMFMPFQPAAMRDGHRGQQRGFGLYIAHQIVEDHGGSLSYTFAEPYVVFSMVLPPVLSFGADDSTAMPLEPVGR